MTAIARLTSQGGAGENLILIHGFGADSLSWTPLIAGLTQKFAVWTIDLPGHGKADADVGDGSIATLSEAVFTALLEFEAPIHVVGHSLGGAVVAYMLTYMKDFKAAKLPKHLEMPKILRASLIAPAGIGSITDPSFLDGLTDAPNIKALHGHLQKLVVRKSLIQASMAQHVATRFERPFYRKSLRMIAQQLKKPQPITIDTTMTQIIWGIEDIINPISQALKALYGNNLHLIENAGHLPQVEATSQILKLINAYHIH